MAEFIGGTHVNSSNFTSLALPAGTLQDDLIVYSGTGMSASFMDDDRLSLVVEGSDAFPAATVYAGHALSDDDPPLQVGASGSAHGSPGAVGGVVVFRKAAIMPGAITAAFTGTIPTPRLNAEAVLAVDYGYSLFGSFHAPTPTGYDIISSTAGGDQILSLVISQWWAPEHNTPQPSPAGDISYGDSARYFLIPLDLTWSTVLPPRRQYPRDDSLRGGPRRHYPPPRSRQGGNRHVGGYT